MEDEIHAGIKTGKMDSKSFDYLLLLISNFKDNLKSFEAEQKELIENLNQRKKPIHLFTFSGKLLLPPNEHVDIFNKLKPDEIYELKIQYRILKKIQELGISFSQYDNTKKIDSISFNAPSKPGTHMLTKLLATSSSYVKFRLIFRIDNKEKENQLEIEKISFSLLSE